MITPAIILAHARAAGAAGRVWTDYTSDDDLQTLIEDHFNNHAPINTKEVEAAFNEGVQQHQLAGGWSERWTTAPNAYDSWGTRTLDIDPDAAWYGKPLRRILIDPNYLSWHEGRYSSGGHGTWTEDPRLEQARSAARAAAYRAEDARRERDHAEGLRWLAEIPDAELARVIDGDEYTDLETDRHVTYTEARKERDRRHAAQVEVDRAAKWEQCVATFAEITADGKVLIDDGQPPQRHRWGNIPGRDPHIYYDVRLVDDWAKIADQAIVRDVSGKEAASLAGVIDRLAEGSLRVAAADQVPPEPVTRRIGHRNWREIQRVAIGARVVWVGRALFSPVLMVLDAKGHLVRRKDVVSAALDAVIRPTAQL